jgi:peptidoglycan hydrolase-like protein with peptidoglycan-binding domain
VSINLRPVLRRACAGAVAVLGATLALGGGEAVAGTGGASAPVNAKVAGMPKSGVKALQRALGIPADGIYGPQTRRAVKRFQRRNGLVVDGIAGPQTLAALGLSATALESSRLPRRIVAVLDKIAACESGGDPTAISADGRYRGKYQFSRATWKAMGGTGDPAKAPEYVQDRLAAKLYRQQGTSPWPNCA